MFEIVMKSSSGNIFRVTCPLCVEFAGQWSRALIFCLICAWINGWVNNREAGDLRRHRAHFGVTVLGFLVILMEWNEIHIFLHGFDNSRNNNVLDLAFLNTSVCWIPTCISVGVDVLKYSISIAKLTQSMEMLIQNDIASSCTEKSPQHPTLYYVNNTPTSEYLYCLWYVPRCALGHILNQNNFRVLYVTIIMHIPAKKKF